MCPSGFVERARLASLLTLTACGDPLAAGTYPGAPLVRPGAPAALAHALSRALA